MRCFRILPALLAVILMSCDSEKDKSHVDMSVVATFESAELSEAGFVSDKSYAENVAEFVNIYDADFDYWHGFAVSSCTDAVTSGFGNQYSVFD